MSELKKMINGELYNALDPELRKLFYKCKDLVYDYNKTTYKDGNLRKNILKELLGKSDSNTYMEPPIYFDYGFNTYVGSNFYSNTNLVILDVCKVEIGNNVMLAPNVAIYTATHPIDAKERNTGLEYGKPVKIGNDVWIGGNVVINPGVTIGNNVVIGSGSVVTKDIESNSVAYGNPCRVVKKLD